MENSTNEAKLPYEVPSQSAELADVRKEIADVYDTDTNVRGNMVGQAATGFVHDTFQVPVAPEVAPESPVAEHLRIGNNLRALRDNAQKAA